MADAAARCFHCGEALPGQALRVVEGARSFCCAGCAAAAEFIEGAGLDPYYRLRQREAPRAASGDFAAWDRDDLLGEHSRAVPGGREISVLSDGMRCAACAWLIGEVLRREPSVIEASANAVTGRIRIAWNPQLQPLSALLARLAALGYVASLAPDAQLEAQPQRERRTLLLRLGVAALGSLQVMMLSEALYLDFDQSMALPTRDFMRWLAWLVATPVVFYSGWPFLLGMWREARWCRPAMDFLVGSAILLAYVGSLVETLRGGPQVWFDAAVMFVFLLLSARALERLARWRANALLDRLARAQPALAQRERSGGGWETVPLAALAAGDVVQVAHGAAVPADGMLLDAGCFDEAWLSGESRPQWRADGASVLAGSQCVGTPVRLRINAVGPDTRLAQLVRLVEAAQAARPALAQLADRVAAGLVPLLLLAAALTYLTWQSIEPSQAFSAALAVLVVSCPCALSLAVPTVLAAAHGALARRGLLALSAQALERLARVDLVLFDKTGSLSEGQPRIVSTRVFGRLDENAALSVAAALESGSGHPLARAFESAATACAEPPLAVEQRELAQGCGVGGRVDGMNYRLGRADYACGGIDDGAIWLGDGREAYARFELQDPLRGEARLAVTRLRALGLELGILSGDGDAAVRASAAQVGITHWRARLSAEAKLRHLREQQRAGRHVLAVGDGSNDAPLLAAAEVSLALASGSTLAHRAADLLLLDGRLCGIADGIVLARRAQRIIRQNLAWALLYNLLMIPLAAGAWITPWLAALGMTLSSLGVTLNALRIGRTAPRRPPVVPADSAPTTWSAAESAR